MRARGGTRTAFQPAETLNSPGNMRNTARSDPSTTQSDGKGVHIVHSPNLPFYAPRNVTRAPPPGEPASSLRSSRPKQPPRGRPQLLGLHRHSLRRNRAHRVSLDVLLPLWRSIPGYKGERTSRASTPHHFLIQRSHTHLPACFWCTLPPRLIAETMSGCRAKHDVSRLVNIAVVHGYLRDGLQVPASRWMAEARARSR
jgi:hypothetical protein